MVLNPMPTAPRMYSAFGFNLQSNEEFSPWLNETQQTRVDVSVQQINRPLFAFTSKNHLFSSPRLHNDLPSLQIFRADNGWGIRLLQNGDFFITHQEITFTPQTPNYFPGLQIAVLSTVLAFWMELHKLCTLHGAALTWQERAFVLLADSTRGKSTLAAGLLQNGARLISDDISVIEAMGDRFMLRPGYPSMRLAFNQVKCFLGQQAGLAKTLPNFGKATIPIGLHGWAQFEPNSQPPSCFYILERKPPGQEKVTIDIQPLEPTKATIALVRHSFVHHIPFITGTSAQRLGSLARLASQVPVFRIIYPSGYENLAAVCTAIQTNLVSM